MNIAIVNARFPPEEGVGYYVYNLSQELLDRGHSVTVVCRGGYTTERRQYDGIDVIKAPILPLYPVHVDLHGLFVNRILSSLEDELDLVHVHEPLAPVIKVDVPMVSTIHTSSVEDAKQLDQGGIDELLFKLTSKVSSERIIAAQAERSEVITTVATSVAEELSKYYDIDDADVVGNGVNPERFSPADEVSDEAYVLFVGRLAHRKGVGDLLEAAQRFLDRDEDLTVKIVGKGPMAEKYERTAGELGIDDRVEFLGYVDRERLVALYRHASVFVLPSHYEGLPTVLLEAMACGRPVVATAVSGCLDVIERGENGVLVPARSPAALADAVSDLLDDPRRRAELGAAARETVLEEYTWDAITDEYEALYAEATGERRVAVEH